MNGDALQHELTRRGIPVRVEGSDRLAILIPQAGISALAAATLQRDVAAIALKHGFTHVAMELTEDWCAGASLSRDQSA